MLALRGEGAGVPATDGKAQIVAVWTNESLVPSELVVPTPLQLSEDEVPQIVLREPCELLLTPNGGDVGTVEPLTARYPLIDVPYMRGEASKKAQLVARLGTFFERSGEENRALAWEKVGKLLQKNGVMRRDAD